MEISSIKRWLAIAPTFVAMLSACNSADEQTLPVSNKNDKDVVIELNDGETIALSDTATYILDEEDIEQNISYDVKNDLFSTATRLSNGEVICEYGYNSSEPESGWKKCAVGKNWEKYGVSQGLYIGRYVKIHKDLYVREGTYVSPANYESANAPKNIMGWKDETQRIGFNYIMKSETMADAFTRLFVIKCDISGRVYNKSIPIEVQDLVWYYILREDENIWGK